jgi:hypothetical protein
LRKTSKYPTKARYLAAITNTEPARFVSLEENDLEQCEVRKGKFTCAPTKTMLHEDSADCDVARFAKNKHNIEHSCRKAVLSDYSARIHYLFPRQHTHFVFNGRDEKLTYFCDKNCSHKNHPTYPYALVKFATQTCQLSNETWDAEISVGHLILLNKVGNFEFYPYNSRTDFLVEPRELQKLLLQLENARDGYSDLDKIIPVAQLVKAVSERQQCNLVCRVHIFLINMAERLKIKIKILSIVVILLAIFVLLALIAACYRLYRSMRDALYRRRRVRAVARRLSRDRRDQLPQVLRLGNIGHSRPTTPPSSLTIGERRDETAGNTRARERDTELYTFSSNKIQTRLMNETGESRLADAIQPSLSFRDRMRF